MGYGLDTKDMERHSVDLRLNLDKAKRRFTLAQMLDSFERIVKAALPQEEENLQPNTLHMERLGDSEDANKLAIFLDRIVDRCTRQDQHELLQVVLRKTLQQSRRRFILDPETGEPQEPMCYFCMADLTNNANHILFNNRSSTPINIAPTNDETAANVVEAPEGASVNFFVEQPAAEANSTAILQPLPSEPRTTNMDTNNEETNNTSQRAQTQPAQQQHHQHLNGHPTPSNSNTSQENRQSFEGPRQSKSQPAERLSNTPPLPPMRLIKKQRRGATKQPAGKKARVKYQQNIKKQKLDLPSFYEQEEASSPNQEPLAVAYRPSPPGASRPHPFEHVPYLESHANIPPPLFVDENANSNHNQQQQQQQTNRRRVADSSNFEDGPGLGLVPRAKLSKAAAY